ncbi:hypothetical protein N7474_001198 [Penicillium riverlandense]|uniref:uncharacterized protein n=1 Tax=Penicillium riverlandense TaxID=1903569 RepID=UPI002548FA23|nr:uncharacterized protein N7474_001198 [Penicillium riverlandense]KAJ5832887.1 hypothetical protein N7474_001198 [Penicillium riverlandense]
MGMRVSRYWNNIAMTLGDDDDVEREGKGAGKGNRQRNMQVKIEQPGFNATDTQRLSSRGDAGFHVDLEGLAGRGQSRLVDLRVYSVREVFERCRALNSVLVDDRQLTLQAVHGLGARLFGAFELYCELLDVDGAGGLDTLLLTGRRSKDSLQLQGGAEVKEASTGPCTRR